MHGIERSVGMAYNGVPTPQVPQILFPSTARNVQWWLACIMEWVHTMTIPSYRMHSMCSWPSGVNGSERTTHFRTHTLGRMCISAGRILHLSWTVIWTSIRWAQEHINKSAKVITQLFCNHLGTNLHSRRATLHSVVCTSSIALPFLQS